MEKCQFCKYWGEQVKDWRDKPKDTGVFRMCRCPKIHKQFTLGLDHNYPPDEAIVEYDEEWGMLTGPEFGCIHWEACTRKERCDDRG